MIQKRTPSVFAEVLNKERMASGPFLMDQKQIGFVIAPELRVSEEKGVARARGREPRWRWGGETAFGV